MAEIDKIIADIKSHLDGTYESPRKDPFDTESAKYFVAISGARLSCGEKEIIPSIILRPTLVEILLPGLLAFSLPKDGRGPHPGPWASLNEVTISNRIELEVGGSIGKSAGHMTFAWLIIALLRLRIGAPIAATFISDRPLNDLKTSAGRENTRTVELALAQRMQHSFVNITSEHIEWLAANLLPASKLFQSGEFQRAFLTFDNCWWHSQDGAAVVTWWAAIETLLRPGRKYVTKRLSQSLSALLHVNRSERDKAYAIISKSYESRGGTVHDSQIPQPDECRIALQLARDTLMRVIESGKMPAIEELIMSWKLTQS